MENESIPSAVFTIACAPRLLQGLQRCLERASDMEIVLRPPDTSVANSRPQYLSKTLVEISDAGIEVFEKSVRAMDKVGLEMGRLSRKGGHLDQLLQTCSTPEGVVNCYHLFLNIKKSVHSCNSDALAVLRVCKDLKADMKALQKKLASEISEMNDKRVLHEVESRTDRNEKSKNERLLELHRKSAEESEMKLFVAMEEQKRLNGFWASSWGFNVAQSMILSPFEALQVGVAYQWPGYSDEDKAEATRVVTARKAEVDEANRQIQKLLEKNIDLKINVDTRKEGQEVMKSIIRAASTTLGTLNSCFNNMSDIVEKLGRASNALLALTNDFDSKIRPFCRDRVVSKMELKRPQIHELASKIVEMKKCAALAKCMGKAYSESLGQAVTSISRATLTHGSECEGDSVIARTEGGVMVATSAISTIAARYAAVYSADLKQIEEDEKLRLKNSNSVRVQFRKKVNNLLLGKEPEKPSNAHIERPASMQGAERAFEQDFTASEDACSYRSSFSASASDYPEDRGDAQSYRSTTQSHRSEAQSHRSTAQSHQEDAQSFRAANSQGYRTAGAQSYRAADAQSYRSDARSYRSGTGSIRSTTSNLSQRTISQHTAISERRKRGGPTSGNGPRIEEVDE